MLGRNSGHYFCLTRYSGPGLGGAPCSCFVVTLRRLCLFVSDVSCVLKWDFHFMLDTPCQPPFESLADADHQWVFHRTVWLRQNRMKVMSATMVRRVLNDGQSVMSLRILMCTRVGFEGLFSRCHQLLYKPWVTNNACWYAFPSCMCERDYPVLLNFTCGSYS